MTFDAEIQGDVSEFLSEAGETVTYTPAGGSPVSIMAVVDRMEEADEGHPEKGEVHSKDAVVEIALDAVNGVASPVNGDAVTIDRLNYTVVGIRSRDAAFGILDCHYEADSLRHRGGHRMNYE